MTELEKFYQYLKDNMVGRVINYGLEGVITRSDLDRLFDEFKSKHG